MRINPRMLIMLVIVVAVVGGFVLFRDRLSGSADALNVGDCFDVPSGETTVSDVQRHPCNEPHTAEVVGQGDFQTTGGDTSYPGLTAFREFAGELCVTSFETYTGRNADTEEEFTLGWFYPIEQGWTSGDREVTCYATRLDETPFTGSLKKAS